MQQRRIYEDDLKIIKIFLGRLVPSKGSSLFEQLGKSCNQPGIVGYKTTKKVGLSLQALELGQ